MTVFLWSNIQTLGNANPPPALHLSLVQIQTRKKFVSLTVPSSARGMGGTGEFSHFLPSILCKGSTKHPALLSRNFCSEIVRFPRSQTSGKCCSQKLLSTLSCRICGRRCTNQLYLKRWPCVSLVLAFCVGIMHFLNGMFASEDKGHWKPLTRHKLVTFCAKWTCTQHKNRSYEPFLCTTRVLPSKDSPDIFNSDCVVMEYKAHELRGLGDSVVLKRCHVWFIADCRTFSSPWFPDLSVCFVIFWTLHRYHFGECLICLVDFLCSFAGFLHCQKHPWAWGKGMTD